MQLWWNGRHTAIKGLISPCLKSLITRDSNVGSSPTNCPIDKFITSEKLNERYRYMTHVLVESNLSFGMGCSSNG